MSRSIRAAAAAVAVMLTLAAGVAAHPSPRGAPDALPRAGIWLERSIDAQDGRFTKPVGLAYLPGSRELAVLDRPPGQRPRIQHLTLVRDVGAAVPLTGDASGIRAITWDPTTRRLVGLDPRRGIVDPRSGRLLTGLRVAPGRGLGSLLSPGPTVARNGHEFTIERATGLVNELNRSGRIVAVRDLSRVGVRNARAVVIAPSGDPTDDSESESIYVADAGSVVDGHRVGAAIHELSFSAPVTLAAQSGVTLVNTIDTSSWAPPSPDPSGLTYDQLAGRLVETDGEVEEMPIFAGANGFQATLYGSLTGTFNTVSWNKEPAGLAFDPAGGGRYFVSNDGKKKVFEVRPGGDGVFWTSDDVRTSFSTTAFGSQDPEGLGYGDGRLFIADGLGRELYAVAPGANGSFDGVSPTGDDVVTHSDLEVFGQQNPEGIDFAPSLDHLFVVSNRTPSDPLIELTTDGALVNSYDLSPLVATAPGGVAYGPSSNDPGRESVFIGDRGVDNNVDPNENDGRIYEVQLDSEPPPPPPPANLLGNGDFESDANGDSKPDVWKAKPAFSVATEDVHGGARSGRHGPAAEAGYTVDQTVSGIVAGTSYTLAGWVDIPPTADAFQMLFRVQWRTASNATISTVTVKTYTAATSGWTQFTADLPAPASAAKARIQMVIKKLSASIYVDDFSFQQTPPP